MQIHVVRRGESLYQISRRYGVTVDQIVTANELPGSSSLVIGLALVIPVRGPVRPRPTIETNAFSMEFNEAGAREVRELGRYLTYLAPFGYRIRSNGSLEAVNDTPLLQAAQAGRVAPMMAISNFSGVEAGTDIAHAVLSNPDRQNTLLNNILTTMRNRRYRGLNIDFENVPQADRENYNQFLRRAVTRLRPENYFVSSSLAPKTSATQRGLLYEAHDYPVHGELLDFVVLMTYEWGYRLGPPQAISPLNRIRAVLDYAVTTMPRNKIMMGFQIYARDWILPHVQGREAQTFSVREAIRRAIQHGAEIHYDQTAQTPYYRYRDDQGRTHEVWFEDARSAQAKFDLAKRYNLRGISYWVLGYPFRQNWLLLEDNFRIRKL